MPSIQHANRAIHYRDDGAGTPVVALHGSASTGRQWDSLTGFLGGRFRMIRPDLPGYGKSESLRSATGAPDLAEITGALEALVQHIGEPVHLVGHSFGGAIALKAARMMPEMVRSLVVIEPAAFHLAANDPAEGDSLSDLVATVEAMCINCAEGDADAAMGRFIDFWNDEGAWRRTSQGLRHKLAGMTGQVMDDFLAISSEMATFADYAAIACPVLAVAAERSPAVVRRLTRRIADRLPTARFAYIADAGHMAPLTDPHIVDPTIAAHVIASEEAAECGLRDYPMAA